MYINTATLQTRKTPRRSAERFHSGLLQPQAWVENVLQLGAIVGGVGFSQTVCRTIKPFGCNGTRSSYHMAKGTHSQRVCLRRHGSTDPTLASLAQPR